MLYEVLVKTYQRVEGTAKRLEMTDILVELFRATPPNLLDKVVYLTQGKLYPDFSGVELGVGEKVGLRAIAQAAGYSDEEVKAFWLDTGDLGLAAEKALMGKRQQSLFSEPLSIESVYEGLDTLAMSSGDRSQDAKIK
ncbi:MAG: DNA ligase, partial [Candidatus Thermoplasmatota archaeon]|nr:DNA ligase [Candidatus Thermoplasmatota archaeon]